MNIKCFNVITILFLMISCNNKSPFFYYKESNIYFINGNYILAEKNIDRAIKIDPENKTFLYRKIFILIHQKKYSELIKFTSRLESLKPITYKDFLLSGIIFDSNANTNVAITKYEESIKLLKMIDSKDNNINTDNYFLLLLANHKSEALIFLNERVLENNKDLDFLREYSNLERKELINRIIQNN